MAPSKLAAGYVRCSTEEQTDSTRQQREAIQPYADKNGFQVIQWFEDFGQSGTSFEKRPGFAAMKSIIEKGLAAFQYVLVYDESRWGRGPNPRESNYWKLHFDRYGVKVKVINTQSRDDNDIGSYVVEVVESAEASEYSKKLSRSTKRGMIDNAKNGNSNGGTPPYGYYRIAVDRISGKVTRILTEGEHIISETEKAKWDLGDPFEIEIVRRIFDLKIKGLGDVAIADTLNREQIPTPKRGRWRNKDQKWSGTTIRTILQNPSYYGARIFNRHPQRRVKGPEKELWLNPKEEWIVTDNAHPAIVTKEIFELANINRKEYSRKNRFFYESPYLLSSLIVCQNCGFKFQGQNYGKQKIRYYVCSGYVNKGRSVCPGYNIRKEEIEEFVVRAIRTRILKSDLPERVEEELSKRLKEKSGDRLSALDQFERSLSDVKMKINRLLTAIENGIEYNTAIGRLKEAQSEKKLIEGKIEEITSANLSKQDIVSAREQVQYLMDNFEKILISSPLNVQKELLRRFIHRIDVDRETDTINVHLKKIPTLNPNYAGNTINSELPEKAGKLTDNIIAVQKKLPRQMRRKKKATVITENVEVQTTITLDTEGM